MADLAKDALLTLLPKSDLVSVPDPERPGRHVETEVAPMLVADDVRSVTVFCDRTGLPDDAALLMKLRARVSYDGGRTFEVEGACTTSGGAVRSIDGGDVRASGWNVNLREGIGRLIEVQYAGLKGTVNTSVSVKAA